MNRREALSIITRTVSDEYIVAPDPDLPHLFTNPDVLIGGNENLLGIFFPKSTELRSPDQLLVRLAISRLALPQNMRSVLVLDRNEHSNTFYHRVSRDFHVTIEARDLQSLNTIIDNKNNHERIEPIPLDIRTEVYTRSNILFEESINRLNIDREWRGPVAIFNNAVARRGYRPAELQSWSASPDRFRRRKTQQRLFQREQNYIGVVDFQERGSALQKIKPYCIDSIQLDYNLDTGIPFPNRNMFYGSVKIVMFDELPNYRFDPEKPFRCAAFAGLLLTRVSSLHEAEEYGDFVLDRIRAGLR